jgi:methylated-DNA-[protein]-cysteine S-methyltransferase
MGKIYSQLYHSPCGDLILGSFEGRLCLCDWIGASHRELIDRRLRRELKAEFSDEPSALTKKAAEELSEYFEGRRRVFSAPLLPVGTDFQKIVWNSLGCIPYGETLSYGELSSILGRPKGVRALASALGANAISIFLPCHRIIGSDGSMTGYAGGLEAKRFLLSLEGRGLR